MTTSRQNNSKTSLESGTRLRDIAISDECLEFETKNGSKKRMKYRKISVCGKNTKFRIRWRELRLEIYRTMIEVTSITKASKDEIEFLSLTLRCESKVVSVNFKNFGFLSILLFGIRNEILSKIRDLIFAFDWSWIMNLPSY